MLEWSRYSSPMEWGDVFELRDGKDRVKIFVPDLYTVAFVIHENGARLFYTTYMLHLCTLWNNKYRDRKVRFTFDNEGMAYFEYRDRAVAHGEQAA